MAADRSTSTLRLGHTDSNAFLFFFVFQTNDRRLFCFFAMNDESSLLSSESIFLSRCLIHAASVIIVARTAELHRLLRVGRVEYFRRILRHRQSRAVVHNETIRLSPNMEFARAEELCQAHLVGESTGTRLFSRRRARSLSRFCKRSSTSTSTI